MNYNENEKKWSVDRHIPITILLAILFQTVVWVWWVATFTTKTELRIATLEQQTQHLNELPQRMSSLESQVTFTNQLLRDIRDDLRSQQRELNGKSK